MMKRIASLFLACLMALLLLPAAAETDYSALDGMTPDELIRLQNEITRRLIPAESAAVVYDKDGLSVYWMGFVYDIGDYKANLIISNTTGKPMYIRLSAISFNGIEAGPSSNINIYEIQDGWGFLASSRNIWLIDKDELARLPFDHITSIGLVFKLYERQNSYDPYKQIVFTFPVDFNLSELPDW